MRWRLWLWVAGLLAGCGGRSLELPPGEAGAGGEVGSESPRGTAQPGSGVGSGAAPGPLASGGTFSAGGGGTGGTGAASAGGGPSAASPVVGGTPAEARTDAALEGGRPAQAGSDSGGEGGGLTAPEPFPPVTLAGGCSLISFVTTPGLSPTDTCVARVLCEALSEYQVTCDGENDGTNTSLCECESGSERWSIPDLVRGESPDSCSAAIPMCARHFLEARGDSEP